jgi:predicted DNA-binding transcriptional regulator AlpA
VEHAHPAEDEWVGDEPKTRSVFIEQAMRMLGVSRRTLYYRIRDGRLQTIRVRGGSQRVLIDSIRNLVATDKQRAARRTSSGAGSAVSSQAHSCR